MGREGAWRAAVIRATRVLGVATLSLMAACSLMPDTEHLTRLGVRVHESSLGWYQLGPDGYVFEMPGVPLAEREEYRFAGHTVDALFYDLGTGANWRRYLLRSFDARALSEAEVGNVAGATQKLRAAATRLLDLGEAELAQTMQQSADQLEQGGQISSADQKQLRYATRKLTQRLDNE